ncbi:MAG: hypothetical protein R3E61_08350 [Pseudomonadales bacterium]
MANLFSDILFDETKMRVMVEQYGSPLLLLDCAKLADQYQQLKLRCRMLVCSMR